MNPIITCFKCNKRGHFTDFFPEIVEGEQMHQDAIEIDVEDEEEIAEDSVAGVRSTVDEDFEPWRYVRCHDAWEEIYSDSDESLITFFSIVRSHLR